MRGSGAVWTFVALVAALAGCAADSSFDPTLLSESAPTELPAAQPAAGLRVNEAVILGVGENPPETFEGALELINAGNRSLALGRYVLRTDGIEWRLPEVTLGPGELYVVRPASVVGAPGDTFLGRGVQTLDLVDEQGRTVDRITVPVAVGGGVLARYPDATGGIYVYESERASLGVRNPDTGFVHKLATGTEFAPRDSGQNAMLTHDGYHWILGGWSNFGDDDWHSYSDVWKSHDGSRWTLVNANPPYTHYHSFIVWRDRMWAIGPGSYSSADGIDWQAEPIDAPVLNRTVVFGDRLVSIYGSTVVATEDGEQWTTLTQTAPWGADRVQPVVVVYDGKIWLMGGLGGWIENIYYNDVWSSSDGITWNLVNPYADWTPRLWSSGVVYDGKMFVINGMNETEWVDQWGNTAEVWFSEDGVAWFPLESERRWGARHASLTTVDEEHGVLLLAGYGHGGVERMYNDVWSLRTSIFFSKADGDLASLDTWGKHADGSGQAPESFDAPGQLFVLRNRSSFEFDESWAVRGAGSRIVVGDGRRIENVEVRIHNTSRPHHPLHLSSNGMTVSSGCSPQVHFTDPRATYFDEGRQCLTGTPLVPGRQVR